MADKPQTTDTARLGDDREVRGMVAGMLSHMHDPREIVMKQHVTYTTLALDDSTDTIFLRVRPRSRTGTLHFSCTDVSNARVDSLSDMLRYRDDIVRAANAARQRGAGG